MHVRIIHQYFKTPEEGGSLRSFYLAQKLVALGHTVSVITAGNFEGYEKHSYQSIEIHYLPVYYTNHLSFISRIHAFWLFIRKSIHLAGKLSPPDVNYVLTTPLSTGLIALYEKKIRGIPYVFEVGDIWPEAPIQLGVIRNYFLKQAARLLEFLSYRHSTVLVGLSPQISSYLEKRNPGKPVYTITNMSPVKTLYPTSGKNPEIESRLGVKGRKVISYIGTQGMANHLEYLLTAFASLPKEAEVSLIIMGGGARSQAIRSMAREMDLRQVQFLPPAGQQKVQEILSVTDAVYVSFANHPILTAGSPNKLFDGLAAGKLIIINFQGWLKDIVETQQCGVYCDPEDYRSLAEKALPILTDAELLKSYQHNARKLAESDYSIERQLGNIEELLSLFS